MNSTQFRQASVFVTAVALAFVGVGYLTAKPAEAAPVNRRGKTYVIIGASSGFGKGVAERLGAEHANVVLAARRTELLEQIADKIRASGGDALVVTTDISKPEEVAHLAEQATSKFGKIDVWINDTGVGAFGRFEEIPIEDHARLIDVNLKGIIYGSHVAMKIFDKQGYGTLINLGSTESEIPIAYHASYAASKAAIRSLDNALRQEIRLRGMQKEIKVCTIMPWAVDTPWWGHSANYTGGTPRMAMFDGPDEVVDAIVHACDHPTREVRVGWKAKLFCATHQVLPESVEDISAQIIQNRQMDTAPPAPLSNGSLFQPMATGTGVDDGVRARMRNEDAERKTEARQVSASKAN